MMRQHVFAIGLCVCGFIMAYGRTAHAVDAVQAVSEKSFPDARQPQLAVDPSGTIYMVFGAGKGVYCTVSRDKAKTFGEPVKVGAVNALALGMRRGPRVAASGKAVVVTAIGGKIGRGRDEDLLAWRSKDGGESWRGPVAVNTVRASAREGLHHLAAGPDGTFCCVWLDLRAKKTQVYGAASMDGGVSWTNEKVIYESPGGSVCECCQPQAAYDAKGGLHVMWRNHIAGSRDMYLTSSRNNGRTFAKAAKLGRGTWPLNACPMDGGGLAASAAGNLVTIWRRGDEIFRCSPGQREAGLGKGEQAWAAQGPDGAYLVWIVGRPGKVMAQLPGGRKPIELSERGSDPVVAASVNGKGPVVVAWEEGEKGATRIRTAVLKDRE